jgi:hypothetical protein
MSMAGERIMDDTFEFTEDLRLVSIAFFIAKRSHLELSLDWVRFFVDGEEISVTQSGELPATQGPWMLLGLFEEGRAFDLDWSFRTGIRVPDESEVVLGHFPDGRLTKATRFQRLQLERFKTYEGKISITVVRP